MKKFISNLLVLFTIVSICQAQNGEKLETWAENLAIKVERLAVRFSQNAEESFVELSDIAEDLANDIEEKFDDGDFDIRIKGGDRKWRHKSLDVGYLGIHSDHISKEKADRLGFKNKYGSYVTKVVKNSAAEKAGLQPFDYIYGVEDQRTSNNQDLTDILSDYESGESVSIHFVRNGKEKTANVKLGDYNDFNWEDDQENEAFLGVRPAANEKSGDMDGVTVRVVDGSAAAEMGLQNDDVIIAINGYPILDFDDVGTAIDNHQPGDKVEVLIKRGDQEIVKNGILKEQERQQKINVYESDNIGWDWDETEKWSAVKGAFLGVYIDNISEKKAKALGFDNPYGSYVSSVIKNTAAEKAGIMPFDYIFGIDEYRVGEKQYLGGILMKYEPGDEATIHLYRKGKKISKQVIFRSHAEAVKESKDKCEDPFFGIIELDKNSGQEGVRVKPVSNSTAKELGMEENDVITFINGYQMYDWMDIGIAINMLTPGDKISVDYIRDGKKYNNSRKIKSYAETKKCKDCDCGDVISKIDIVIPDKDFHLNISENKHENETRVDVEEVNVAMENVSDSEARNLVSKGIDMKISNDLRVTNLKLSPNPNIGMFELQFDLESKGETMVKVVNPAGRGIYEYDLGVFNGDFSDYIDISQNGPGTYFLQIIQNGKSFVRKIILTNN